MTSTLHRLAATVALVSLSCGAAVAQQWPARTIRAVVPLTAGSATDTIARSVLDQVSSQLGQPIIVENRPGAGNTIGMAAVARAEPDGYSILINSSSHTTVPAMHRTCHSIRCATLRRSCHWGTCRRSCWYRRRRVTSRCPT
jgi:tripartite-type tricarboxylate transporter receptor subunit TctC